MYNQLRSSTIYVIFVVILESVYIKLDPFQETQGNHCHCLVDIGIVPVGRGVAVTGVGVITMVTGVGAIVVPSGLGVVKVGGVVISRVGIGKAGVVIILTVGVTGIVGAITVITGS